MNDEAARGYRVTDGDRGDPQIAEALLGVLHERPIFHHRRLGRDLREIRPAHVVEDAGAERVDDGLHACDRERLTLLGGERERLREKSKADDVIEMSV